MGSPDVDNGSASPSSTVGRFNKLCASQTKKVAQSLSLRRLQRSTEKTRSVHQQASSPLFQLPREIRDEIWGWTLTTPYCSRPPHFHVYDDVYDSCTYYCREDELRRQQTRQIGLLLTCRAAYAEGVQFLYDWTDFTLVVCAGSARPDPLRSHNRLGKLGDMGPIFMRMRSVRILVQPGERPHGEKYAKRLASLLQVLQNGKELRYLCLQFNFHINFDIHPSGAKRFVTILAAFKPLRDFTLLKCSGRGRKSKKILLIKGCSTYYTSIVNRYLAGYEALQEEFPGLEIVPWTRPSAPFSDVCLSRGMFGMSTEERPRRDMTRTEKNVWRTVMIGAVLAFPVTVPVGYGYYARHKFRKGEW